MNYATCRHRQEQKNAWQLDHVLTVASEQNKMHRASSDILSHTHDKTVNMDYCISFCTMSGLMRVVTSVTGSQSECTHIVEPDDLVGLRPGRDGALEVDVVALGDVVRVEAGAQLQPHHGGVCNGQHIDQSGD